MQVGIRPTIRPHWRLPRRSIPGIVLLAASILLVGAAAGAGPARPDTSTALGKIRQSNRAGHYKSAERDARAALSEAERVYGSESAEVAEILDELAAALRRGGRWAEPEALEICERALRIKERVFGAEDPRCATSLYNLGLLYLRRKDCDSALASLQRALDIRIQALGDSHPDVAKCLMALGSVQYELGNYWEDLALTERGVAIEKASLGATNPERANGLDALAGARYCIGDFAGSIALYEEAVSLWEHSPTPKQAALASHYQNLGALYAETGDYGRATRLLERALRLLEAQYSRNHPMVAYTLSNLGIALQKTGDLRGAEARLRRAVAILEAAAPHDVGWHRAKLGWVYLDEGDLSRAGRALPQALREMERALGPNHARLWTCLRGLAMLARDRGQVEEAREYYERTVSLVRGTSGPKHPDLGKTLAEYAAFQLDTGDSLSAINTALQAAEVNREHLKVTARATAERQALLYTSSLKTGLEVALAALPGKPGAGTGEPVRRVWDAVVRSRALVLAEVAWRTRIASASPELARYAMQLDSARTRLANLFVRGSSGEAPERDRVLVEQAREDVERAERELAARSSSFARERERTAIGWDQVASALPAGSALVSFVGHGEGRARAYTAFVLGPDEVPRSVPLGSADEIDRLIARWRRLAGTPPPMRPPASTRAETACRSAGEAVRVRIWDPLAGFIIGSKTVFIVPDGSFHLLNLAALPTPRNGYLIESSFVFHHLSAERALVSAGGRASPGVGLLALGGASFDQREMALPRDSIPMVVAAGPAAHPASSAVYREALNGCDRFRSFRFEPLPETTTEVDEIRGIWGRPEEVVVLEGRSAGERSVKELLPGRMVAHFATHGFFLDGLCGGSRGGEPVGERGIGGISGSAAPRPSPRVAPYRFVLSGLALAGANRRVTAGPDEEDGILTAEEIASLDLSGLDWVVLSACDTGVGEIQTGEGVLGLRRAFEIAGANTLIMSLWAVEDRSTREWMNLLYEGRLRRHLETAEAVREADLGVLKSLRAQGASTHPFYWAAFVAAGGWR